MTNAATILDAAMRAATTDPRQWRTTPPSKPGTYAWRNTIKWEPVTREIADDGTTYSHRYCKRVPAARVEGEWFY